MERVEKAIKSLNYQRDARATALASRSNNTLGLLTGNLADPFFALIAKHVEEVARQQGCQLVVVSGGHNAQREKEGLDFLISQGCEAMVVHSKMLDDSTAQIQRTVTCDGAPQPDHSPDSQPLCVVDNRKGAAESVKYLIDQGHRKIACVTSDLPIEDRTDRLEGYRDAMQQANLAVELNGSSIKTSANTVASWLLSDEIWGDLAMPGHQYHSALALPEALQQRLVVAIAASKTFGLSSLRISNFMIQTAN